MLYYLISIFSIFLLITLFTTIREYRKYPNEFSEKVGNYLPLIIILSSIVIVLSAVVSRMNKFY